jgi:hypothetical protein
LPDIAHHPPQAIANRFAVGCFLAFPREAQHPQITLQHGADNVKRAFNKEHRARSAP